jgi:hypothetical protein
MNKMEENDDSSKDKIKSFKIELERNFIDLRREFELLCLVK